MSAHPAPVQTGAKTGATPGRTLRDLLDARHAEGRRLALDEAVAVIVPVCVDLKERHARGETLFVHASAIARGPDGLMRVDPSLAKAPTSPSDKAALAPELQAAPAPGNSRASVFAIGALLYEMVTGAHVGPGMRRPKDVDPTLPSALDLLLAKALVGDPAHRPDDLGALASAMHHLAPMKSIPPPDADLSRLDRGDDFEVDVKLSLMPPSSQMQAVRPTPAPASAPAAAAPAAPARRDATTELAQLKARLESDMRPRYVVNKDHMDHGPFAAVELLQQIASHTFTGKDILRDELSGVSQELDAWEEFAPFCEHAKLHRDIVQEKKEVEKVEKAEKKAGVAKYAIGAALALLLVGGATAFIVKKVGERRDSADLEDDPSALALDTDGGLAGGARRGGRGRRGGGGAGGGGGPGGGSFESVLNSNNEELNMGGAKVPDLTQAQLAAPMRNASFVSACGAPDSMKVTVKVAVKMGRAVGVSVYTNPPNPGVASCIDRRVRGITWPSNPKTDFVTTTY